MKRNIKIVVYYPGKDGYKIYFSTDINMDGKEIIEFYRIRFQIEFCFCDSKQFTGLEPLSGKRLEKLDFAFNASLASVNIAKIIRKEEFPTLSIGLLRSYLCSIYMMKRFLVRSGIRPNSTLNDRLVKELLELVSEAA